VKVFSSIAVQSVVEALLPTKTQIRDGKVPADPAALTQRINDLIVRGS
jgi:hypothetical protein